MVGLLFNLALEGQRTVSHSIPHDHIPTFTSGHSQESQEGRAKVLEIGVNVEITLQLHPCKEENTNDRV